MEDLEKLPLTTAQFEKVFEIFNEFMSSMVPLRGFYSKEKSWKVSSYEMEGEIFIFSIWFRKVKLNHADGYRDVTYTYRILPDGSLEGPPMFNGKRYYGW